MSPCARAMRSAATTLGELPEVLKCDQHVAGPAQHVNLLREDHAGVGVVADRAHQRAMRRQRDGRHAALKLIKEPVPLRIARKRLRKPRPLGSRRSARKQKVFHQLADDVLRIGRAAAIAANEHLVPGPRAPAKLARRPADDLAASCQLRIARAKVVQHWTEPGRLSGRVRQPCFIFRGRAGEGHRLRIEVGAEQTRERNCPSHAGNRRTGAERVPAARRDAAMASVRMGGDSNPRCR